MGTVQSVPDADEIPAYLQRGINFDELGSFFYDLFATQSESLMTNSAKFDDPKPYGLQVSDDTWACLQLRVDPLARAVLDPHRLYLGSLIMFLLVGFALSAVRPDFRMQKNYDDDDAAYNVGYYANDDAAYAVDDWWQNKDVDYNEWKYRNHVVKREKLLWNLGFGVLFLILASAVGMVAWMMETRNKRVDLFIKEVIDELSSRFEQEGYGIAYKTRTEKSGPVRGHLVPERVICFRELSDEEINNRRSQAAYTPPSEDPEKATKKKKKKEAAFGSINVMVPEGYSPGQVVNVMTPSGLPIMVAVPQGVFPGQSFPVQIPAQMYRPRK